MVSNAFLLKKEMVAIDIDLYTNWIVGIVVFVVREHTFISDCFRKFLSQSYVGLVLRHYSITKDFKFILY